MLAALRIRNLAIAGDVRVEFRPGLNVITGETGAGKSLLIAALGLLLGDRGDRGLIRAGEDACFVEGEFLMGPGATPAHGLLEEMGLPACEERRLTIRRSLSATGAAGRCHVNDAAASTQALARLGDALVDLHGPHDHQSLLKPSFQLEVADAFGRTSAPRKTYAQAYGALRAAEHEREAWEQERRSPEGQEDLLRFQWTEIEEAALTEADEGELDQELTRVGNAARIVELAQAVCAGLSEADESAFQRLAEVQRLLPELQSLMGGEAREWLDEARAAAMQVQELSSAIAASAGTIEADPGRLQSLEQRHSRVNDLKRRYGGSVAAALAFAGRVRERLDRLAAGAERAAELEKAVADARRRVKEEGQRLSEARAKAVGRLARAVTVELRDLGFSHGVFSVAQRAVEPQPSGMDEVEFGFAPNAGEPARPLRAIASSGEISRVMLATKTVLAAVDCIPVLVFDEIDANVGGEMGTAIGRKLARIAGSRQVLCITHLPQVAAQGEAHYVVDKQVRAGRTTTGIRPVDGEARIEEVARMLGGRDLTSVTLRHARELLASCAAGG